MGLTANQEIGRNPVGADLSAKGPVQPTHLRRLTATLRGRVRSHGFGFDRRYAVSRNPEGYGFDRKSRSWAKSSGSGLVREGVSTANTSPAPDSHSSRTSPLPRVVGLIAGTQSAAIQKVMGLTATQEVGRNPVGADLSAKGSVQPTHFRRLTVSLRGRVRSHGFGFDRRYAVSRNPEG